MPIVNGIGFGNETREKHQQMLRWGQLHQEVAARVIRKTFTWAGPCYYLIDTTAGNGLVAHSSEPSYDIELLRAASRRFGVDLVAHLIEREGENARLLMERMSGVNSNASVSIYPADHCVILSRISHLMNPKSAGLVIFDPNPGKENIQSAHAIGAFAAEHRRKDIMAFLAGTMFKRIKDERAPTVMDFLQLLRKDHWRMGPLFGANQYVVVVGSNWHEFPDWERTGFVDVNSTLGQARVELLTLTEEERKKKQLTLPFAAPTEITPNISAIRSSWLFGRS